MHNKISPRAPRSFVVRVKPCSVKDISGSFIRRSKRGRYVTAQKTHICIYICSFIYMAPNLFQFKFQDCIVVKDNVSVHYPPQCRFQRARTKFLKCSVPHAYLSPNRNSQSRVCHKKKNDFFEHAFCVYRNFAFAEVGDIY